MSERSVCSPTDDSTHAQEPAPEACYWARRQALRPLRLFASVLLGLAFITGMGWLSEALDEPTDFDRQLTAVTVPKHAAPWAPSFATKRSVLEAIDFEYVHARLLPDWVISLQHDPYTVGRDRESRRFSELVTEAGRDPNLASLLHELRDRATSGVTLHAAQISHLLDGWNAYMQDAGLPWYVAYDVLKTARGGRLYTRSYRIHADVSAQVAGLPQHLRVLVRVDDTNVGELFFGQTTVEERRAVVVSDRITEFALDRLWPMMDPAGDGRLEGMERAFAPALRREAAMSLSSASLSALRRGAETRRGLQQRLDEIGRRDACGKGIEVENLPWNGLTPKGQSIVARAAAHNAKAGCSLVTEEDAELLIGASNDLANDAGLHAALGQLAAWLAQAVSVHEVRHLADSAPGTEGSDCEHCPSGMTERGKAEVSAYVASIASPGVGYLSLYQACGVDIPAMHDSGGALDFVLGVLMPNGCDAGPGEDLYAQARLLDWVLFKRVERIELPEAFPDQLPLPAVRTSHSIPGFESLAGGPLQTRHGGSSAFPMRAFL